MYYTPRDVPTFLWPSEKILVQSKVNSKKEQDLVYTYTYMYIYIYVHLYGTPPKKTNLDHVSDQVCLCAVAHGSPETM